MSKQSNQPEQYDVVIIGAGPAGLTCAIYASRGNLKTLFIDKGAPGGKVTSTFKIENWPGDTSVKGFELAKRMFDHAQSFGAKHKFGNVTKIVSHSEFDHEVHLEGGLIYQTKAVVIATGMLNRIPKEVTNIEVFENRGVSYCVICDGPFYKDQPAAIIGGGNSAFEEAIYLASVASEVNIFVREAQPIAEAITVDQVAKIANIKVFYNAQVLALNGQTNLESIDVKINDQVQTFMIKHLYPYIGFNPSTQFLANLNLKTNSQGFIEVDENLQTSIKGIYAIGDVINKNIRQIGTAVNDGTIVGKILANKIQSF